MKNIISLIIFFAFCTINSNAQQSKDSIPNFQEITFDEYFKLKKQEGSKYYHKAKGTIVYLNDCYCPKGLLCKPCKTRIAIKENKDSSNTGKSIFIRFNLKKFKNLKKNETGVFYFQTTFKKSGLVENHLISFKEI